MITRLLLENWKSHSKSEFAFGKGANILLGRMGSGKSSVLDALCFALYGTYPKISRRDQNIEDIVSIGSISQYAKVTLELEHEGKKYEITRMVGKGISDAQVRQDGILAQKGQKATTEYISDLLGVDYDLFSRAIYSEQNKIDYLLSLNPRARKQEIDWLLGLGKFDEAQQAAQSVAGKLQEKAQMLSAESPPEKIALAQKRISEIGLQISQKEKAILALKEKESALKEKLKESESRLFLLSKAKSDWISASSECERQKGATDRLKKEVEGKRKPAGSELEECRVAEELAQKALLEKKAAIKEAQMLYASAKGEVAVLESRKKSAEAAAKRKSELEGKMRMALGEKSAAELEAEIAKAKAELEELSASRAGIHAEIEQLSSAVAALGKSDAKCPVCDSDLSGGKAGKLMEEKMGRIAQKELEAKKVLEAISGKKAALASLERLLSEVSACAIELAQIGRESIGAEALLAQLEGKRAEAAKLEGRLAQLEEEVLMAEKSLQQAKKRREEMEQAARLFSELEEAERKLKESQERLSRLKFSEEEYEKARQETEGLRLELARASESKQGEERQLQLLNEMHKKEKSELDELAKKRELAKMYSDAAESMAIYKNSLVAVQREMRNILVEEINQALMEIWPAIYPYSDYLEVKLEASEKDYQLLMQKGGKWLEVDSIASGGERACLCLALRIAFAAVLTPNLGWLILDEPTHNLDSDAVALLARAIYEKIPSIVEQTFVITHDSSLAEQGEGLVFLLERDKGKNEPSRVEKLA